LIAGVAASTPVSVGSEAAEQGQRRPTQRGPKVHQAGVDADHDCGAGEVKPARPGAWRQGATASGNACRRCARALAFKASLPAGNRQVQATCDAGEAQRDPGGLPATACRRAMWR
jgi:hypothetical protein